MYINQKYIYIYIINHLYTYIYISYNNCWSIPCTSMAAICSDKSKFELRFASKRVQTSRFFLTFWSLETWKIAMLLIGKSWKHIYFILFLWAMAFMAMLNNQRVYIYIYTSRVQICNTSPQCHLGDNLINHQILRKTPKGNVPHTPKWAGWLYTCPSEKYEFVSWDDEIPNIWEPSPMWRKGSQQLQRQQKWSHMGSNSNFMT